MNMKIQNIKQSKYTLKANHCVTSNTREYVVLYILVLNMPGCYVLATKHTFHAERTHLYKDEFKRQELRAY